MKAVTAYGLVALSFMMAMYALERRGRGFVLAFALGCVLSSAYGFWSGTWPFGVVEAVWAAVALRRYMSSGPDDDQSAPAKLSRGQRRTPGGPG